MRPDSVPDLGAMQIIYLLTYLLTHNRNIATVFTDCSEEHLPKMIAVTSVLCRTIFK